MHFVRYLFRSSARSLVLSFFRLLVRSSFRPFVIYSSIVFYMCLVVRSCFLLLVLYLVRYLVSSFFL